MRVWFKCAGLMSALVLASASAVSAQATGSIMGAVTDRQTAAPVVGAHVSVVGTNLAVLTTAEGRYVLPQVPVGEALVLVRAMGYASAQETVTVGADATATVSFELQPQAVALDELVVVGYGTQRREEITGSVSRVSREQFIEGPARSAASLVVGRIPGLVVVHSSGDPRSTPAIQLRGVSTIRGSASPLVLIDGIPGDLTTVSPQDIESIEVLRDGSAAAVYGSRAANGVLLITTRRHDGAAPTIRYEAYTAVETIYNRPDMLTADEYRALRQEHALPFPDEGYATDWIGELLRTPVSQRHSVTVAGGGTDTNYLGAVTYEDRQGIFRRSELERITGRLNVGHSMFDGRLHADFNLLTRIDTDFRGPSMGYIWRQAMIRNPMDRIRDENGAWQERTGYFYINPLGLLNEQHGQRELRQLRMHGVLTFRPIDNLRLSLLAGTSRGSNLDGSYRTMAHHSTVVGGENAWASRSTSSDLTQTLEMTGTYSDTWYGHNFTVLGGYTFLRNEDEFFNASNWDFPTDVFGYYQLQRGDAHERGQSSMSSGGGGDRTIGFFGRLNYDWNNRYLLMVSGRYEGDSRFGANHQWGWFPAIQAGWRVTEEDFIRDRLFWLSDLKLRVGFGVTGMAPTARYLHQASYSYGARFPFGGDWVQGLTPSRNPNPDLRWERKDETNVGMDFSLFDYRLFGSLDVYRRDTKDLLYSYSVPSPPFIFGSMLANVGRMRNQGIEADLTYDVIRRPGLRWSSNVNFSTNSNRLVSLTRDIYQLTNDWFTPAGHTGEPVQQWTHRVWIGERTGYFWGWESVDIDEQGRWIVLSADGEPISMDDAGLDDRRKIGNGTPRHYAAWNNTVRWGNVDLSSTMRGAFGFQILNHNRMFYENPRIQYNVLRSAFHDVYGKRTLDYDQHYVSYYIEDGDYWKVDNVTLGYTFDMSRLPGLLSDVVTNVRVYVSGRNLWTITGYKGLDPEVPQTGLSPGNDFRDGYPTIRSWTFGMNLAF